MQQQSLIDRFRVTNRIALMELKTTDPTPEDAGISSTAVFNS
jgi:hypothetical protein